MAQSTRIVQLGLLFSVLLVDSGCKKRTVAIAPAIAPAPSPAPSSNVPLSITPEVARSGPDFLYPNVALNPGFPNANVTQNTIAATICNPSWSTSTIRPPQSYTDQLKLQEMPQYGDTVADRAKKCVPQSNQPSCYEEDHLIALEDGGHPTDPRNLWPEPYKTMVGGVVVGAKQKDLVENFVHDEICFNIPNHRKSSKIPARISITLARGQQILSMDWYACYLAMQQHQDCQ
jgi:hypothetical protein